jgi:hypothetical protein
VEIDIDGGAASRLMVTVLCASPTSVVTRQATSKLGVSNAIVVGSQPVVEVIGRL